MRLNKQPGANLNPLFLSSIHHLDPKWAIKVKGEMKRKSRLRRAFYVFLLPILILSSASLYSESNVGEKQRHATESELQTYPAIGLKLTKF